jgi:hypothetical protein
MPIHVVFVDWNSDGKLRTHTHPVHVHLARVDPSAAVRLLLCCRRGFRVPERCDGLVGKTRVIRRQIRGAAL